MCGRKRFNAVAPTWGMVHGTQVDDCDRCGAQIGSAEISRAHPYVLNLAVETDEEDGRRRG